MTVVEGWLALPHPRRLQARTVKLQFVKGRTPVVTLYMKLPSRNIRLDTCSVPNDMKEDVWLIFCWLTRNDVIGRFPSNVGLHRRANQCVPMSNTMTLIGGSGTSVELRTTMLHGHHICKHNNTNSFTNKRLTLKQLHANRSVVLQTIIQFLLLVVPRPCPAFHLLQNCKQRKAGQGLGMRLQCMCITSLQQCYTGLPSTTSGMEGDRAVRVVVCGSMLVAVQVQLAVSPLSRQSKLSILTTPSSPNELMSLVLKHLMKLRSPPIEPLPLLPNTLLMSKLNVEIWPSMVTMTSSPSFCQVTEGRGQPVVRQTRVIGRETLSSVRLDALLIIGYTNV